MITKSRVRVYRPQNLNIVNGGSQGTSHPLLGQTGVSNQLDRSRPIEEILVRVKCQISTNAACTLNTAAVIENVCGIVKKIQLTRPAASQLPAGNNVWLSRGIYALEHCANEGFNLPDDTLGAISLSQGATIAASQFFNVTYRLPMVHPAIAEPLRSRCLLPCHTWSESPVLALDFETAGNLYTNATAGVIQNIYVEIVLITRDNNPTQTANILKAGGYIPMDVTETSFPMPVNSNAQQYLDLPLGGKYLNLQFCHYLGGGSISRGVIDANVLMGQETITQLLVGGNQMDGWTWDDLKELNSLNRPRGHFNQTYAPALGLPVFSGTSYNTPATAMKDFITDGIGSSTDPSTELGSVLDTDAAKAAGQTVQILVTPASVATNASVLYIGGRRLWGDLSPYQALVPTPVAA